MVGDERVRVCASCSGSVCDVRGMTRTDAAALLTVAAKPVVRLEDGRRGPVLRGCRRSASARWRASWRLAASGAVLVVLGAAAWSIELRRAAEDDTDRRGARPGVSMATMKSSPLARSTGDDAARALERLTPGS